MQTRACVTVLVASVGLTVKVSALRKRAHYIARLYAICIVSPYSPITVHVVVLQKVHFSSITRLIVHNIYAYTVILAIGFPNVLG